MIFPTYHSHCRYCDGEENPEEYVRRAIDAPMMKKPVQVQNEDEEKEKKRRKAFWTEGTRV